MESFMSNFAVASSAGKQETGDRNQKQKIKKVEKVQKFEKVVVPESGKSKIIAFPCGSWILALVVFGFEPIANKNV